MASKQMIIDVIDRFNGLENFDIFFDDGDLDDDCMTIYKGVSIDCCIETCVTTQQQREIIRHGDVRVPSHWELQISNVERFPLNEISDEYKHIRALFDKMMAQKYTTIIRIERVVYGQGAYFSANASYSHKCAKLNKSNSERSMLVVSVIVGNTTRGNSAMKTPPEGFDSTTDGDHIFVTYRDDQAFAEYLIVKFCFLIHQCVPFTYDENNQLLMHFPVNDYINENDGSLKDFDEFIIKIKNEIYALSQRKVKIDQNKEKELQQQQKNDSQI
ncbi:unnamed protein product [Rotaria sp. Silwood1]|nr:unnamed protein product [Rotaria sp. Silwood1]